MGVGRTLGVGAGSACAIVGPNAEDAPASSEGHGGEDRRECEPRRQGGTDEAVAERPGTREAPCHESPTDEAAACGVISVPGGIRFAHVSGIAATSSCFHPRAFIDTVGVAPSEWMYPWSDTKA